MNGKIDDSLIVCVCVCVYPRAIIWCKKLHFSVNDAFSTQQKITVQKVLKDWQQSKLALHAVSYPISE